MLTDEYIRKQAGAPETYFRGIQYFKDGRVVRISILNNVIYAEVAGSGLYEVEIELDRAQDKIKTMYCSCPPFHNTYGACKHLLLLSKQQKTTTANLHSIVTLILFCVRTYSCCNSRFKKRIYAYQ